jgi:hypothetical protein
VGQLEPRNRPPATPTPPPLRREAGNELEPAATFFILASGIQLWHPGPLRSMTSTLTTLSMTLIATVIVSPGAPDRLCRTLLPKISLTRKTASSAHG